MGCCCDSPSRRPGRGWGLPDETRPVNLAPLVSKKVQLRGTFRFNDEIDAAITLLDQNP